MFDAGAPHGSRNHWRSAYCDELSDAAIDTLLVQAARMPAPMGQLHIHRLGGAMSGIGAGATAFGSRDARSAYDTETFTRLQSLKARHDPDNVFRLNQNISPAA